MNISLKKISNSLYLFWHELGEFLSELFSYTETKLYFVGTIIVNALAWLATYQIYHSSPLSQEIALHYNVDFGINLIGAAKNIFVIPAVGLIILVLNILLLFGLRKNFSDKRFNRQLILAFTLIANLFLLIATIILYIVNLNQ